MIEIVPLKELDCSVNVPGSKYIANRVLIIAALCNGISKIKNVPKNDDINNTIKALKQFGVKIRENENELIINGTYGKLENPKQEINVGDSGTLLRFITSFAGLVKGDVKITGSKRIEERPIKDLLDSLHQIGIESENLNKDCAPFKIIGGNFEGGLVNIKANISSQYVSSLLLVAPYAKSDVKINVDDDLASKRYVDLTISLMQEFGIKVERKGYKEFMIKSGQKYNSKEFIIPADHSSASYFMAAAAIFPGEVRINNINPDSIQGESRFFMILEEMGCRIEINQNSIYVKGPENLKGVEVDMSSMPDVVQTLTAISVFANSKTVIKNISNLRYKESNRIEDTAKELRKLGIKTETSENEIIIYPDKIRSAVFDTHKDHRMAMSLALIGLRIPGIKIKNPECVNKSFPGYWNKLKELGVGIKNA